MADNHILSELQFLPGILFFSKIYNADILEIEAHENYTKRSYRNRCYIATAHGKALLSIPLVKGKNQQMSIRDVLISYEGDWQSQYWKTIKTAYNRSPFFEFYEDLFYPIFNKKIPFLFDYNLELLSLVCKIIQYKGEIRLTDTYVKPAPANKTDLRNAILPNIPILDTAFKSYPQVFSDRQAFIPGLSILDLIFCCGPSTSSYLKIK